MKKLLALVVAAAFTFTAASGFAEEVKPVKVEAHASKAQKTVAASSTAPAPVHKAPVKKTAHASKASATQKAQAKKTVDASAASAASAVHKAPTKKVAHTSKASAVK